MNFLFGSSMNFVYPFFLFFLFLIPLFVLIYFLGIVYSKKKSIGFPNFEALQRTGIVEIHSKNIFYLYIFILIMFFLILALARTSIGFNTDSGDYSYVIALDNSNSMGASDLAPNRLEVSKIAAKNFINNLPLGVKIGVISFSGEVGILSYLDSSKYLSLNSVDKIELSSIGGTNLRDAVFAGEEILKNENSKVIIIVSDGQINLGNFSEVIDYAKEKNIIIDTIIKNLIIPIPILNKFLAILEFKLKGKIY